jgi:hypothetical protein
MRVEERRRRWRVTAQAKRDRELAKKMRTAATCPHRLGRFVCGGKLEIGVGEFGQTVVFCPWCKRRKAGICQWCDSPVYGYVGRCRYCKAHRRQSSLASGRRHYQRDRTEILKRDRAEYWSNAKRRARSIEYKRLWRKVNPEKIREQKKRYIERARHKKTGAYKRYHARYRKKFALHRRDIVRRLAAKQRRPIPNCDKCGKPTGWTPVPGRTGGRPWDTCMKCCWPFERRRRRKIRRDAAKRIAADPKFGLPAKPVRVPRPEHSPPRGPGDERLCIGSGCDIVVSHRKKKCTKCQRRDAELAAAELAKTRGRGRRVDLERVA